MKALKSLWKILLTLTAVSFLYFFETVCFKNKHIWQQACSSMSIFPPSLDHFFSLPWCSHISLSSGLDFAPPWLSWLRAPPSGTREWTSSRRPRSSAGPSPSRRSAHPPSSSSCLWESSSPCESFPPELRSVEKQIKSFLILWENNDRALFIIDFKTENSALTSGIKISTSVFHIVILRRKSPTHFFFWLLV